MTIRTALDRIAQTAFIGTASVLTLVGFGLWAFQRKLIYPSSLPPGSRTDVWKPEKFGMEGEDLTLESGPERVKIQSYLMLQANDPKSRPTVLMLHANAGNNGHRLPIARIFVQQLHCNVMLPSYRGYGKPSEEGIGQDAQTALDYLLKHDKIDSEHIILYGQSIGGAVAIDLAARNIDRIAGVIVENTFESLPALVPSVMPAAKPFLFLLSEIWPSITLVPKLTSMPILFLSGEKDELVPPSHVKALYDACSSDRKTFKSIPDGTHNDTFIKPGYWQEVRDFLAREIEKIPLARRSGSLDAEKEMKIEEILMDEGADAGSVVPGAPPNSRL